MYDRILPLGETIELKKIEIKNKYQSICYYKLDNSSEKVGLSVCNNSEDDKAIHLTIDLDRGRDGKSETIDIVLPKRDLTILITK